jgi:acyl-CoA synthetase (AMP-forming)/AMP-acid ligase II
MSRYAGVFQRSLTDPAAFWGEAACATDWVTPPGEVLDTSTPPFYRWFSSGTLHTSGTTGRPKGVVRDNGGNAVAWGWSMANIDRQTAPGPGLAVGRPGARAAAIAVRGRHDAVMRVIRLCGYVCEGTMTTGHFA